MEEKRQDKESEKKEEKAAAAQSEPAKKDEKQAEKKKPKLPANVVRPKEKKHEAAVCGKNLPISTKHALAICRFIKGKTIQQAISDLEQVARFKKAVPFKGEIPHRRGKGMSSGRYPVNAARHFIKMLKNLSANAAINELDADEIRISAKADLASRKRFSMKYRKFKRSNVLIVAREIKEESGKKLESYGGKNV